MKNLIQKYLLAFIFVPSAISSFSQGDSYKFSRFTFTKNSSQLTDQNKDHLDRIIKYVYKQPSTLVGIVAFKSEKVADSLTSERINTVTRYFMNQGLRNVHFYSDYKEYDKELEAFIKIRPDSEIPFGPNDFQFVLQKGQLSPCDSGHISTAIHFNKTSNEIFETECNTLRDVYNVLKASKHEWAVIGVSKSKSEEARAFARERVERVIAVLVKMGLEEYWFVPFVNYHKAPEKGKPADWPYYPDWYEYEIGVYFQPYLE